MLNNPLKYYQFSAGRENTRSRISKFIVRPDGNSTGSGAITWTILQTDTNHKPSGKQPKIEASGSNLRLRFPKGRNVIWAGVLCDETLEKNGVSCGVSFGVETVDVSFYQNRGNYGGRLIGNGSSWTRSGDANLFTFGTMDADTLYFRPPKPFGNTGTDAQNGPYWTWADMTYKGTNTRRLVEKISGLGSDYFGFELQNADGTAVATNDANDIIRLSSGTPKVVQINANSNDSTGNPGANVFTTSSNIWVYVEIEY